MRRTAALHKLGLLEPFLNNYIFQNNQFKHAGTGVCVWGGGEKSELTERKQQFLSGIYDNYTQLGAHLLSVCIHTKLDLMSCIVQAGWLVCYETKECHLICFMIGERVLQVAAKTFTDLNELFIFWDIAASDTLLKK